MVVSLNNRQFYQFADRSRSISGPVREPIEIVQLKKHLRVSLSDNTLDDIILSHLQTAREWIEGYCDISLITQTRLMTLDNFPQVIELDSPPIQSVTSIQYIDQAGATQTLSSSVYTLDVSQKPGRIAPKINQYWPNHFPSESGAVFVTYVAGYGDYPIQVPQVAKTAIVYLVRNMLDFPEGDGMEVAFNAAKNIVRSLRWRPI